MAEAAPLKRIAFVQGYAATATGLAESAYKTARGFVPGFVEPYVRQAEETALNVGAPYLTLAQDGAEKVLRSVDAQVRRMGAWDAAPRPRSSPLSRGVPASPQVDASLNTLAGALNYSRDLHDKNMITFNGAKEQYFGLVESAVAQAKALLDPSPYVQRVEGTVKWASDKVAFYVDPDKIVDTGVEYAGKVAAFGPGERWRCTPRNARAQPPQAPLTRGSGRCRSPQGRGDRGPADQRRRQDVRHRARHRRGALGGRRACSARAWLAGTLGCWAAAQGRWRGCRGARSAHTPAAAAAAAVLLNAPRRTQVSPLYKKLVELLLSTGTSLTATWPAKKLVEVSASPVVAPLADPLISNFTNSKYLKQLTTHLKPL